MKTNINNLKQKNDEESKKHQIILANQYREIKIERKRSEELYNQTRIYAKQIEDKWVMINEIAKKKGINIERLDNKIDGWVITSLVSGELGLSFAGTPILIDAIIGGITSNAGCYVASASLCAGGVGLAIAVVALGVAGLYKIKKSINS